MTWLIFIHSYLWRNSFRRWWEQPLSLLSKLVIAALLGLLGAFVTLGIKELGSQLDARLTDREALTAVISETWDRGKAVSRLDEIGAEEGTAWSLLPGEAVTFLLGAGFGEAQGQKNLPVVGVKNMEDLGLVDDFYLFSESMPEGRVVEFSIGERRSEAIIRRPGAEMALLLDGRPAVVGELDRLAAVFTAGFTETTIYRATELADLEKAKDVVGVLNSVEGRRVFMRSSLGLLKELEKVRTMQAQALLLVTLLSAVILGLVYGSLAWMEFREERYLLALIRTFGVNRLSLLAHALAESLLLAVGGVLLGFAALHFGGRSVSLERLNVDWLAHSGQLFGPEGWPLLIGAALGALLSAVPVAIGLRKPLGLVLS